MEESMCVCLCNEVLGELLFCLNESSMVCEARF
jgi:hypothetical protein